MAEIKVTGTINQFLRSLKQVDPDFRKTLVKRVKEIGKPVETAIKSELPVIAPLSGMNNNGRLGWGIGKPVNSTTLSFKATASRYKAVTPLLRVIVNSPATVVADMAGRRSSGSTPSGRNMIKVMNARARRASRYVYPAGEKAKPGVEDQIKITIEEAARTTLRNL
jgi:hypothetical protein